MATESDPPAGVLRLLIDLDEVAAVPVRHGRFVGCLNAANVPPELWKELARHDGQLLRMLPNRPTPYRQRKRAG